MPQWLWGLIIPVGMLALGALILAVWIRAASRKRMSTIKAPTRASGSAGLWFSYGPDDHGGGGHHHGCGHDGGGHDFGGYDGGGFDGGGGNGW